MPGAMAPPFPTQQRRHSTNDQKLSSREVIPAPPSPSTSESIAVRPLPVFLCCLEFSVPRRIPKTNSRHTHLPTFSFATELARCVDVARVLVELLLRCRSEHSIGTSLPLRNRGNTIMVSDNTKIGTGLLFLGCVT